MSRPDAESLEEATLLELRRFVATLASEVSRLGALVEAKDGEIAELQAANTALKSEVQDLKDEIARLKGLPPRPKFKSKPSGMERSTSPGSGNGPYLRRPRRSMSER